MADDRLQRLAVLQDLTLLTQLDDALRQGHRQALLTRLGETEHNLRALIANPGPLVQAGEIATRAGGELAPDPGVRLRAERLMGRVHRERKALLGGAEASGTIPGG